VREFDENSITRAVIARLADADDPRFKRVMTALISHLHDFVREVELTEAEWLTAIEFLTDAGRTCTSRRQESGRVLSVDGRPLQNALLDIWSGDGEGNYDMQIPDEPGMRARGRIRTDEDAVFGTIFA
jgi:protocatechuate 3,4-dioxygenase beta subunit